MQYPTTGLATVATTSLPSGASDPPVGVTVAKAEAYASNREGNADYTLNYNMVATGASTAAKRSGATANLVAAVLDHMLALPSATIPITPSKDGDGRYQIEWRITTRSDGLVMVLATANGKG